MGKGPVTKCSFPPKRERYSLKKLVKTAALTVLANFFFGVIFQNFILQQTLLFRHL